MMPHRDITPQAHYSENRTTSHWTTFYMWPFDIVYKYPLVLHRQGSNHRHRVTVQPLGYQANAKIIGQIPLMLHQKCVFVWTKSWPNLNVSGQLISKFRVGKFCQCVFLLLTRLTMLAMSCDLLIRRLMSLPCLVNWKQTNNEHINIISKAP